MNRSVFLTFLFFLLFLIPAILFSQQQEKINYLHRLVLPENACYPNWSKYGKLVFQAGEKGEEHIFLYDPEKNRVTILHTGNTDSRHPVWVPGKNAIVYDTGTEKTTGWFIST